MHGTKKETVRPHPVTNHAVTVGRQLGYDRLIAYDNQPHLPYIGGDEYWAERFLDQQCVKATFDEVWGSKKDKYEFSFIKFRNF